MTPDRARLIENLYAQAVELDGSRRAAFLGKACGEDRELYREVESLLVAGTNPGSFMESPALGGVWSTKTTMEPPAAPSRSQAERESEKRVSFTPGTILADRYRIVSFLGRGGMGDVYRAEDLTLGHPVALKFLPPALASDPVERERFLSEVRITRQLSHPNICRVYDIGKSGERYFLSMEYIDGEDLSSLLKRIGYLPAEKALEVSRQLLSGLSAAHERGVLHRDLKPPNIMLDGHGHIRIMDFGLAIMETEEGNGPQRNEVLGTPAYMAPEQFAGKPATAQSDIYALGLVLYEIYCGKRAFSANTIAELKQQKETETPRAPSELRQGVDPDIDRLIMKCIERNPAHRPASVRQIAAAFGGGDPLRDAVAAGETPSPELVAAFGRKEGLQLRTAIFLLLVFVAASIGAILLKPRTDLLERMPVGKDPAALLDRAREYVREAGYSPEAADTASGLEYDAALIEYIRSHDRAPNRWDKLNSLRGVVFWYRQSPYALERKAFVSGGGFAVSPADPPMDFQGEVLVRVSLDGKLKSFEAIPESVKSITAVSGAVDWVSLFASAGLEESKWTPVEPKWNPGSYADSQVAWEGVLPEEPDTPLRIEAASYRGKPVRFELIGPWTQPPRVPPVVLDTGQTILNRGAILFVIFLFGCAVFFARKNLRLGRGDRRGATTLALMLLVLGTALWLAGEHHVSTSHELTLGFMAFANNLVAACGMWVCYIALEPAVRRRWPSKLVSSTRLMAGQWRDPLLGREVLIGSTFGAVAACIQRLSMAVPVWLGRPEELPLERAVGFTFASSFSALGVFYGISWAIADVAILLFLFLLMRTLFRREWVAMLAVGLLFSLTSFLSAATPWIRGPGELFAGLLILVAIMRCGVVAATVMHAVVSTFLMYPMTFQFSAWYSRIGFIALAWAALFALFGFFVSTQGQRLLDLEGVEKP